MQETGRSHPKTRILMCVPLDREKPFIDDIRGCGEPCFAGAAILIDGYLPQIPRRGRHKSIQI
jgi:hypothetical protein